MNDINKKINRLRKELEKLWLQDNKKDNLMRKSQQLDDYLNKKRYDGKDEDKGKADGNGKQAQEEQ